MGSAARPGIRTKELILDAWIFAVLIPAILRSPSPSRQARKNADVRSRAAERPQAPSFYGVDQPLEMTMGDVRLALHNCIACHSMSRAFYRYSTALAMHTRVWR